ncbi:helix-hairpin-helix domain-containing protein [Brevibacillus ruminantium]|uniref:Helix-hairpin-helix domain-containing protein n=1 Tax=Brevibacillus ruminantium TaxID=2950604 RepID=A0ABY4WAX0_9BACL|nr:helix-hairpin-helix domain-containing protein [Brevibacillus ruminantium]USG64074.1 helix-hairpin-helix domain-containing protein [Brevibacillus ruminantium]
MKGLRSFLMLPLVLLMACSLVKPARAAPNGDLFERYVMPAESDSQLILQSVSGEYVDRYPVAEAFPDDATDKAETEALYRGSFMRESVKLYHLAQNYLKNQKSSHQFEPAYLLLSDRIGGFARKGFYLRENGSLIDKTDVPYIDLMKKSPGAEEQLGATTQIYPHEMGHLIYHMLSQAEPRSKSVTMHYSGTVTDYATAFNEGFAEHFEKIARRYDPDEGRRRLMDESEQRMLDMTRKKIAGYDRDYDWLFRLDFYRASLPFWYQQLENTRRHHGVDTGELLHPPVVRPGMSPADSLLYRNTGIHFDKTALRSPARMISTEGVISGFFTRLLDSELKEEYLSAEFYRDFLREKQPLPAPPEDMFSPLQNQYLKIFAVLHKHVNPSKSEKGQMLDFLEGYGKEFPGEKQRITELFREATGDVTGPDIASRIGPEIWLTARDVDYPFFAFDQFKGNTFPAYSFSINAADVYDLMMIPGLSSSEAESIIRQRDSVGFFRNKEEILSVPDLSEAGRQAIEQAFEEWEPTEWSGISFTKLFGASLFHVFGEGLLYFVVLLALPVSWRMLRRGCSVGALIKYLLGKLGKTYWLIALGLFSVMVSSISTLLVYLLGWLLTLLGETALLFVLHRQRGKIREALMYTAGIGLVVLCSVR